MNNWTTIGFKKEKALFEHLLVESALSHAYLFSGPAHIGKRMFARELAARITSVQDILEISPADSESKQGIDIDTIRRIKEFCALSPFSGSKNIVIIDQADSMTEAAQQALLKLLEEPNPSSIIILIATYPEQLLTTIRSRVQDVMFCAHNKSTFLEAMSKEKLSDEQKEFLYYFSLGAIGFVRMLIDKGGLVEIKQSAEHFVKLQKMSISERFDEAKVLTETDDNFVSRRVLFWMLYLHARREPLTVQYRSLALLSSLYTDLQRSNVNRQLALENFMLQL